MNFYSWGYCSYISHLQQSVALFNNSFKISMSVYSTMGDVHNSALILQEVLSVNVKMASPGVTTKGLAMVTPFYSNRNSLKFKISTNALLLMEVVNIFVKIWLEDMNVAVNLVFGLPRMEKPAMVSTKTLFNIQNIVDINECLTNNGDCSQLCRNEEGGRRCECFAGYTLGTDGRTCVGEFHSHSFENTQYSLSCTSVFQ